MADQLTWIQGAIEADVLLIGFDIKALVICPELLSY